MVGPLLCTAWPKGPRYSLHGKFPLALCNMGCDEAANMTGPHRSALTVVQKLFGRSPENGERPRARAPGRSARTTSVLRVSGAGRVYGGLPTADEGADGVGLSVDRQVEAGGATGYRVEEG